MKKKILLALLAILVVIQFIHPKPNKSKADQPYAIYKSYATSPEVKVILEKACLDCHSNNTRYPWYTNFEPIDWWTTSHINGGKSHMNFDEYTNKSLRSQFHHMESSIKMVKEDDMPLNSYLWIHKDAKLTPAEKQLFAQWAQSIEDTMKQRYPIDSLIKKK